MSETVKAYRVEFIDRRAITFYGFVSARRPSEARRWAERNRWSDEHIGNVSGPFQKERRQVMNG